MGCTATTLSVKPCAIPVHWNCSRLLARMEYACYIYPLKVLEDSQKLDSSRWFWQLWFVLPLSTAETTPMRSCKCGGNTTESSVPLRSRPCPGALQRSMAAATQSVRAQSPENTASHSTATLYQHKMALPCSYTTYIHQNPIHVTDKLPADRKAAKNQLPTTYCTDLMLQLD